MIKNSSNLIFLFSMILGTLISISSNSWLGVWMGLEINLLSFIPLMVNVNNLMSTEASLKYFLTQAFASSILLFSMILTMMIYNLNYQFNDYSLMSILMLIPLLIKSGVSPFHFWFPNVIEGMNWMPSLILMTWQKIAPMLIISYLMVFNYLFFFIIVSVITGAIGGLNQTSIRKIMAFSSINHLGWMLSAMMFNEYLWMFYFLIYSFISLGLILLFNQFKLFYLNQLFNLFSHSFILKFSLLVSFLSLAGLPPFLGFLPKWMVIQSLSNINQYSLIMIMILMSLVTMYFYLRICFSAFMLSYKEMTWNNQFFYSKTSFLIMGLMLFSSIMGLFIFINMIYLFY
uniref:NADH-ubiquinone oxidoreductase chain 2 n=1 Tax=Dynatosoma fuscicorne TaxID=2339868 RepID=A0A7L7S0G7_9DIPT|nr:NADH dehydrogenase subunit 2 [Dynatosoma fuscicorne]